MRRNNLNKSLQKNSQFEHIIISIRGGFPPVRGLPDYESSVLLAGALLSGAPECRYCHNWAITDTPGSPDYLRHLSVGYSRTALSSHSLTIAYLQICPGFHRTAVLRVRAFTVLQLLVSGLSPYCCSTPS